MKKQNGFTVLELMIVVAIFSILVGGIFYCLVVKTIVQGNFWGDDAKLLACVQQLDKEAVKIDWVERRIFDLTRVKVKTKLESMESLTYYADTNILQNCTAYSDSEGTQLKRIR